MIEADVAGYERFILDEMAELIGGGPISLDDSFLKLGGDSLKAILLASAIEERYGIVIDVVDVFQCESLRELGRALAGSAAQS